MAVGNSKIIIFGKSVDFVISVLYYLDRRKKPTKLKGTVMSNINRYATILSNILLDAEKVEIAQDGSSAFLNGRLKGLGRITTIMLLDKGTSLSFSINVPYSQLGYQVEILNQYLNEESFTAYAQHAYESIMA